MIQDRLLDELDKVAARFRHLRFWQWLAAAWLLAALVGLALLGLKLTAGSLPMAAPLLALAALVLAGVGIWLAVGSARNYVWVARQVESTFPELRACLITAVEQRPELPGARFGYLQANVIHQALLHAQRQRWDQVVPGRQIAAAVAANVISFGLLVAVLFALGFSVGAASAGGSAAALLPAFSGDGFSVTIEPGDTEVERGGSLLVLARVAGTVPAQATLVVVSSSGEESRLAMSRSLDDPLFATRVSPVNEPLDYFVEIGGQTTPIYHAAVFEYPRLERADARLAYPAYTELAERLVQDVRTISVVEGTRLTLLCYLNKPVASATLVDEKQDAATPPVALAPGGGELPLWQATVACDRSLRLRLDLVDEAGRKNVQQASFSINVLPNQPAALKPTFPARDLEVSPLEELDVKATVWDDFGVKGHGLAYSLAGQEPVEIVLAEAAPAKQKHELAYTIRLEDLRAEPDQLLSYHWWAEDLGPDGQPRRVESDMYFAEVRPFEEIFRQGEQPPGGEQQQRQPGQGQNAQQAQQLAQRQKEIINATWKVVRREITRELTPTFATDVQEILTSQETALAQAGALGQRVQDAQSQEHVAEVLKSMQAALEQLGSAQAGPAREPLPAALAAEQAAYQALLKLRAREHRVVRQQRQQSSASSSASRSEQQRQQLQQLDLQNEENRYETQRLAQAQQPETPEEREDRQVLNRLRELARRQHDLNERVKELQSALEEARTPEERDDLQRQLKRLQEEQRQVLEDTDELQSRMEQPENQERMAEERQQLEEAREAVRRSSEALQEERVTQAAATGTRAERQFEELRNEFRRRAAGQFSEQMRDMRDAARELDQRQEQLGEQLSPQPDKQQLDQEQPGEQPPDQTPRRKAKSLADDPARAGMAEELAEQRRRLENLQQQMRDTIQQAEETEPLLAERLYEAARGVQEKNLERTLEGTQSSLQQGLLEVARQQEAEARRGIGRLREGIDKAAEAVLGDETEALRRAREELESLSRQLNEEIRRNQPGQAQTDQANRDRQQPGEQQGQARPGEGQPGERRPGQSEPGEQQSGQQPGTEPPGQSQPGQQQPGQQQPGQQQPGEQQSGQQPGEGSQPRGPQPGRQSANGQAGSPAAGQNQQGQNQQTQDPAAQPGGNRSQAGERRAGNAARAGAGPFEDSGEDFVAPLTGERFLDWSDRLRDVEEMVEDPDLRAEAARIRERAREVRAEFKRHSTLPQWDLVREQVAEPLAELQKRVSDELLRRTSKQAIAPLDRDPVPARYLEKTRQYYERLGTGK